MTTTGDHRDELLELADCEVLGALDPSSSDRLERLFRDAPANLRQEVIDRQARLASDGCLLPMLEPDASLRHRVIETVRGEIEAVEIADQRADSPLASIGGFSSRYRPVSTHRSGETVPVDAGPSLSTYAWRRAALVWRATAVVLAGGLIAAIAFNIATTRQATRISELALQRVVSDQLLSYIGPDLSNFLDQRGVVRGLVGTSKRENGSVSVMITPDWSTLLVTWIDLPTAKQFTLRTLDQSGGLRTDIGVFSTANQLGGAKFDLPSGIAGANSEWEIVDDRGAVIFSSTP